MRRFLLFAASTVALVAGLSCQVHKTQQQDSSKVSTPTTMSIGLPAATPIGPRRSFGCRSLMESDMTGSYDPTLTKGLQGRVSAGVNAVSIEIEGPNTLAFLSEAGFSAGTARGPSFEILRNSEKELVATYFDGSSINTFVLNKSNGLAIWSKIRPEFPGYAAPTGAQSYLVCR